MRRWMVLLAVMLCVGVLGGCGKKNATNPNGDENEDDVYVGNVMLVPKSKAKVTNSGVNFGLITIYEEEYDIFSGDLEDFEEATGMSVYFKGFDDTVSYETEDFSFYANRYRKGANFTVIYLEMLEDEQVFLSSRSEKDRLYDTEIKGFAIYAEDNKRSLDDYECIRFYGDINMEMTREEIESLIGEGIDGSDYTTDDGSYYPVIYKSEETTMVIEYEESGTAVNGEAVMVVDKIFVLKN